MQGFLDLKIIMKVLKWYKDKIPVQEVTIIKLLFPQMLWNLDSLLILFVCLSVQLLVSSQVRLIKEFF